MALSLYRRHRRDCKSHHPEESRSGEFEERKKNWKRCDDLSPQFLARRIDVCKVRPVADTTGEYELTLGNPVLEVLGIRRSSDRALVDFRWHFESLNEIGRVLPGVQATREQQTSDDHLTPEEKAIAPFWTGLAELAKYEDGRRVLSVKLDSGRIWERWQYGPEWPDPYFNWNAFDENQNRY